MQRAATNRQQASGGAALHNKTPRSLSISAPPSRAPCPAFSAGFTAARRHALRRTLTQLRGGPPRTRAHRAPQTSRPSSISASLSGPGWPSASGQPPHGNILSLRRSIPIGIIVGHSRAKTRNTPAVTAEPGMPGAVRHRTRRRSRRSPAGRTASQSAGGHRHAAPGSGPPSAYCWRGCGRTTACAGVQL